MQGVETFVRNKIIEWGRGRIFTAHDLAMQGDAVSVRQALVSLTDERFIVRLARGLYCFPKLEGEYTIRTILPTADMIAQEIAEKAGVRIVPYGDQAAYLMGFTSLQMGRYTFLTDGAPRRIGVGNGVFITFLHTSEMRIFMFRNTTMQLLCLAIRTVGRDGITPEIRSIIADRLTSVPKDEFEHDIRLAPAWVSDLIFDL